MEMTAPELNDDAGGRGVGVIHSRPVQAYPVARWAGVCSAVWTRAPDVSTSPKAVEGDQLSALCSPRLDDNQARLKGIQAP